MRKYGTDKFTIEILEETSNGNEREIYWIQELNPHYNMTSGGDGGDTSNSPNFKQAIMQVHKNRVPSDYATYGMQGKKQSTKFYDAIQRSNNCPCVCEGIEYPSVGAAELAYPGIKVRRRLDNPKYPEFYRLRDKTRRK